MIYQEPELELYDQFPDNLLICILVHVDWCQVPDDAYYDPYQALPFLFVAYWLMLGLDLRFLGEFATGRSQLTFTGFAF